LDGWVLAQIAVAEPMAEEELDDVMPWRSAAAAGRAVARALEEFTDRPWHVRAVHGLGLLVGPPPERLLPDGELAEQDRRALAERFGLPAGGVRGPAVQFPGDGPALRECLARAEGRAPLYTPEVL
jgi:hypothetical protein